MIGMVLAAGLGKRLGHETAELPKTLLGVDGDRTILDIALANFAHVGLTDAVIVTGYAHDRLAERVPELERRHGLDLELVFNAMDRIRKLPAGAVIARRWAAFREVITS